MVFEELPQPGAGAVDLVPADEVQPDPVAERLRADIDGQLPFGAELQVWRQAHDQAAHRVIELGGRYPLPGADQRVPGVLPHIRQVHSGNPVSHLAHAPQNWRWTPARHITA